MDKKTIKNILSDDLIKISSTDFNDKIISKLKDKPVLKSSPIFKPFDVFLTTIATFLLFVIIEYKIINNVDQTTLLLSISLIFIPVAFIAFNKIHQLTINQKKK